MTAVFIEHTCLFMSKVFMRKSVYISVCRSGEYLLIDPNIIPNDCSCLRLSYLNIDDKIKILHCTDRLHFLVDCDFCSFWTFWRLCDCAKMVLLAHITFPNKHWNATFSVSTRVSVSFLRCLQLPFHPFLCSPPSLTRSDPRPHLGTHIPPPYLNLTPATVSKCMHPRRANMRVCRVLSGQLERPPLQRVVSPALTSSTDTVEKS